VNRGKETREKERVSARLRVQREERGAERYGEKERKRHSEGERGDDATRRGEDQCARRGSPPHTSFKNSLCRESRLALPLSRRRSRGCAATLVLLRSSLTAERPSRETGCKSYRGTYRRYLGRIGQPCSILRSRSKATRELSSIRCYLDVERAGSRSGASRSRFAR